MNVVRVQQCLPLASQCVYGVTCSDGHVVVEAEAMWAVRLGVVARGTDDTHPRPRPSRHHLIHHLETETRLFFLLSMLRPLFLSFLSLLSYS